MGIEFSPTQPPRYKRLIVAIDGTWVNENGHPTPKSPPTNVTRILDAIRPASSDGTPQIQYYHAGIGSSGPKIQRIIEGATAAGLGEGVREGYNFIASNYVKNDEIFLLGFSRGAYTARAIAGLIGELGILTRDGMAYFPEIYRDVQYQHDKRYVSDTPNLPFRNKPSFNNPRYLKELIRLGLTTVDVPIKAVGVWDTVGSLGVPRVAWLQTKMPTFREMTFYDTTLSNNIEHAFQALALDEKRASFQPAVWEKTPDNTTDLHQVWFPGVHSNIGGGYPDQELANITLAWMMGHLMPYLDIDTTCLFGDQQALDNSERNKPYYTSWSFGNIYKSLTSVYTLAGSKVRTPGAYCVIDPDTGRETTWPLRNTHEAIHPSVRVRKVLHGPGPEDKGDYDPPALRDRRIVIHKDDQGGCEVFWKFSEERERPPDVPEYLPECALLDVEKQLLSMSSGKDGGECEKLALDPTRSSRSRRKKRRK